MSFICGYRRFSKRGFKKNLKEKNGVMKMAVRIVKEGDKKEQLIYAPEKLSICWNHLGGKKSVTEAQRKKLKKLFENPVDVILKIRKAFGLEIPKA